MKELGLSDGPAPEEVRAIMRHPLNLRLNRELLESFEREKERRRNG